MNERERTQLLLEKFPYALIVAAAPSEKGVVAIVATWAMQVSFTPPMVALAAERGSAFQRAASGSGIFSLNFLAPGARAIAQELMQKKGGKGGPAFRMTEGGHPLLSGASGSLGCRVVSCHGAGDHDLLVANVEVFDGDPESEVLTLRETGWRYRR